MSKTWRERCIEAIENGFTEQDVDDAIGSWLTCAIGEQSAMYPELMLVRKADMLHGCIPEDPRLFTLGKCEMGGFGWAVRMNQPILALDLLDQIEDRVLELKRQKEA